MIVVDSSVWIDYFNGSASRETDFLHQSLGVIPVAVGDVILTEVLQGFREDLHFRRAKALLDDLTLVEMVGYERVISAALKYRRLRAAGITVRKTHDVLIGSYCIDESVPLLFSDRDFVPLVEYCGLQPALPP